MELGTAAARMATGGWQWCPPPKQRRCCCSIPSRNKGGVSNQLQTTGSKESIFGTSAFAFSSTEDMKWWPRAAPSQLPAQCVHPARGKPFPTLFLLQFLFLVGHWRHLAGEGDGDRSLDDLWSHTPPRRAWPRSWCVPNPQNPVQLPAVTPRLKGRVVQKPRCFWCSQNPGEDRDGATSPTPTSLPHGGDPGQGSPALASPLINNCN